MLSLSNAFTEEEVDAFDRRVRQSLGIAHVEYAVEPKFDGLAISLCYENGMLVSGATRGVGYMGAAVTLKLKTSRSLPFRSTVGCGGAEVPAFVEVRGEALILKAAFAR